MTYETDTPPLKQGCETPPVAHRCKECGGPRGEPFHVVRDVEVCDQCFRNKVKNWKVTDTDSSCQ